VPRKTPSAPVGVVVIGAGTRYPAHSVSAGTRPQHRLDEPLPSLRIADAIRRVLRSGRSRALAA
jgi:hypothetical protein